MVLRRLVEHILAIFDIIFTVALDPKNKTNLEIVRAPNGDRVPQKVITPNPAAIDLNNPPGPRTAGWVLGMYKPDSRARQRLADMHLFSWKFPHSSSRRESQREPTTL